MGVLGEKAAGRRVAMIVLAGLAVACVPALNWRETQVADSGGAMALFPCKVDRFARRVRLADVEVEMRMLSCSVDGVTYAVTHAQLPDPASSALAMAQLRATAASNVAGLARSEGRLSVPGSAPGTSAERVQIAGRRADGRPVAEAAVFFSQGASVFQATVLGDQLDAEAVDTFFGGLKLAR